MREIPVERQRAGERRSIPVAYINLDRAGERRAFMEAQGRRLGLDLERLPAVSAADVSDAQYETLSTRWERRLTRIELALLLSHRALWIRARDEPSGLVILEDDAVLSNRLPAFLEAGAPPYDLVNLEYFGRAKFFRGASANHDGFRLSPVVRDKSGSAAYFVSPDGARKLLRAVEAHAAPSDAFLFRSGRVRMAQAEPALAVQAHVLAGLGVEPGIATVTQIHEPRPRMAGERLKPAYFGRRLATQLGLLPLHLRRALDVTFRKPAIDVADFDGAVADQVAPPASSIAKSRA
ncbi:glycosyltransferase family 25 protein [Aurantimonas sp. Leaf443]|uniref:glycosyltransferase family 25 protein n=1 Tax=Aurantimonas sp. Leaf443 TaxID=1736378 RepID=UPI0007018D19|nr:glycosyltransferase family 25 protein [Aurantimonas sp. Leaf443]KQT83383.1 hypothetical protein ASG48_12520 [Aurantimonas sp. Leaf443]